MGKWLVITCIGMYCCIIDRLNSYFFSLCVYQTICAALTVCYSISVMVSDRTFSSASVDCLWHINKEAREKKNKKDQYQESTHPQMGKRESHDMCLIAAFPSNSSRKKTKQKRGYKLWSFKRKSQSQRREQWESQHSLGSNSKCSQIKDETLPFLLNFFCSSSSDEKRVFSEKRKELGSQLTIKVLHIGWKEPDFWFCLNSIYLFFKKIRNIFLNLRYNNNSVWLWWRDSLVSLAYYYLSVAVPLHRFKYPPISWNAFKNIISKDDDDEMMMADASYNRFQQWKCHKPPRESVSSSALYAIHDEAI